MPKAAAAPKPEVGHGWTGLPASAADIAAACPAASREQLRSVLTDVALTGCVWRTQLRTVLQGVAHYANWLNIAGLNRDMFSERGVEAAIPAFVLRQFVDALSVLPIEHEAALELQAHAKALQWPAISASRD